MDNYRSVSIIAYTILISKWDTKNIKTNTKIIPFASFAL